MQRSRGYKACAWCVLTYAMAAAFSSSAKASYVSAVNANSPSNYYRLEETTGTTATDSGLSPISGTYTGTFTLNQAGIPGGDTTDKAVAFSTNGYVNVNNYAINGATPAFPFTIEAFVKTTDATSATPQIAGITGNAATSAINQCIDVQAGKAGIRVRNVNTFYTIASPNSIADGQYHQIVGVFTDATDRFLYVDGQLVASDTNVAHSAPLTFGTETPKFGIGGLARGTAADFLNGTVDEVSVYNTSLNASQVLAHYQASGVPEPTSVSVLAIAAVGLLIRRRVVAARV